MAQMGSGNKRMVINPRERAVSSDINRLQAFAAADMAELFRQMLQPIIADETYSEASDPASYVTTVTAPLTAVIINGLLVQPQLGSTSTFITPGVAYAVNPDSTPNPDDSPFKLVNDPGRPAGEAGIAFVANTSGSTRVDIVECQCTDVQLSSENRDIYNQISGMFAPALVYKTMASRFAYRLRQGTPGAGLPALASGWLPLMVAVVPNGVTTWTTAVQCYDVRPLISESANGVVRAVDAPWPTKCFLSLSPGSTELAGYATTTCGWFKAGGALVEGGVGLKLDGAKYLESGFALPANGPVYIYACFPAGLPRWVIYDTAMVPNGPRGIMQLSTVHPSFYKGAASSAITLSATRGLGATPCAACACLGAFMTESGAALPAAFAADGTAVWQYGVLTPIAAASFTATAADFTLNAGVHFPNNARAIYVQFALTWTGTTTAGRCNIGASGYDATGAAQITEDTETVYIDVASGGSFLTKRHRIPLDRGYPADDGGTVPTGFLASLEYTLLNTRSGVASAVNAYVVGWELAP
jgi:hypothetical protein